MAGPQTLWTIDQLARLAADALSVASPTQPNGRIREVPDIRTIRWYTSIGLLDRPAAMRGRTALYGRRHLAQLVAIKRLQADGLSLTAVQERLIGSDEAAVEAIAMLPELDADSSIDADMADSADAPTDRSRFWSTPPRPHQPLTEPPTEVRAKTSRSARPHQPPTEPPTATRAPLPAPIEGPPLVHGVRLTPDVTLLLSSGRVPDAADLAAVEHAARPLLDLLHRLGLSEA